MALTCGEPISTNSGEASSEGCLDKLAKLEKTLECALRREGLSPFSSRTAINFLRLKLTDHEDAFEGFRRVLAYLLGLVNSHTVPRIAPVMSAAGVDITQSGCPSMIPGLRAKPFWDTAEFPWVKVLEENYPAIRAEFMALKSFYCQPTATGIAGTDGEVAAVALPVPAAPAAMSADGEAAETLSTTAASTAAAAAARTDGPFQHYRSPTSAQSSSSGSSSGIF
jgi:hypothetical protein